MARRNSFLVTVLIEAVRIGVIVLILDRLVQRRETIYHRKTALIAKMGSRVKEVALEAVEQVRAAGWLTDGSLQDADFAEAHLSGAMFDGADLRRVSFVQTRLRGAVFAWADLRGAVLRGAVLKDASFIVANLEGASLSESDLRGAVFRGARMTGAHLRLANLYGAMLDGAELRNGQMKMAFLRRADLSRADLRGADLYRADLREANLTGARLEGADLRGADLTGADLSAARFDPTTVLPDGNTWSAEVDLGRFTQPDHPDYWRYVRPPDWPAAVIEQQRAQFFERYEQEAQEA